MDTFLTQLQKLVPGGNLKTEVLIQVLKQTGRSCWSDDKVEFLRWAFPETVQVEDLASWLYDPTATLAVVVGEEEEDEEDKEGRMQEEEKINSRRYTEPANIWEALRTRHVRLVRMSWLIGRSTQKQRLPRRQELPEEAFLDVDELQKIYEAGRSSHENIFSDYGGSCILPIVAISFCWLTPEHPDPFGQQLATVASALEREQHKYIFNEMGVFWDWVSLYQKDSKGNRTEEETHGFSFALKETMDLWYAHQGTHVYLLTKLPENASRKIGYGDSGWTTYERCSAEQIKKFWISNYKAKLVLDLGVAESAEELRNWPIGPDDFDKIIKEKTFTNSADTDDVKELFRKMSRNQLGGINSLDFDGMKPPSLDDARCLGGCLNFCVRLTRLYLSRVGMTSEALVGMLSALSQGALGACQSLALDSNQIGDDGMRALADALVQGALGACQRLDLKSNHIGDDGMHAFADALSHGALGACQQLSLESNKIGDAGMRALTDALGQGALGACQGLCLNSNQIGDDGMLAFADALSHGALGACQELGLESNQIGDDGMRGLADALGQGALGACHALYLNSNQTGDDGRRAFAGSPIVFM